MQKMADLLLWRIAVANYFPSALLASLEAVVDLNLGVVRMPWGCCCVGVGCCADWLPVDCCCV